MNKTELKNLWGKYTDTDKLVDDISSLLTECKIKSTTKGICIMLNNYFTKKEPLINLLAKSKRYIGDMRISIPVELERTISQQSIRSFVPNFRNHKDIQKMLLRKEDDANKTLMDYLKVGEKHFDISELDKYKKDTSVFERFDYDGYTKASVENYQKFRNIMDRFYYISRSDISQDDVVCIKAYDQNIKITKGLKTSRAFNKICCEFGVDKMKEYNKLFAQYSDMVSPGMRKLDYIISVNPYDYLTMSFGESWTSCHSLRNGGYRGGTLSYMLDRSSIITYVINKDGDPQKSGKIYRNMIHYNNSTFIQARVYPQENDGATDLYTTFRNIICEEMSEILELKENKWFVDVGKNACKEWTTTPQGAHYRDYLYFNSCNVFSPSERGRALVSIGSNGICPVCGEEISSSSAIVHSNHY